MPVRRKIHGSLLYTPSARRGSYEGCEEAWIVAQGPNVHHKFHAGQLIYVRDGFELEPTDMQLWDKYKDHEAFSHLKKLQEYYDGDIVTQIVIENSIEAYEEKKDAEINGHVSDDSIDGHVCC